MNKQLMMILTSLALSFAAASTSDYPYDGIYYCTYESSGSNVNPSARNSFPSLREKINKNNPLKITIENKKITFYGFQEIIAGDTAIPRIRDSQRYFRVSGNAVLANFKKGDLLYKSDGFVQIFYPRSYEFKLIFLSEKAFVTHSISNCTKEGGNNFYNDPEKPTQIIERTDSRNIGGKVEYELALEAEGKRDNRKYIDLLLKSADLGYTDAMVALGFAHEMNRNYGKAYSWYRKAIQKGSKKAAYHLAEAYRYGVGVEENWEIAERLYHQSWTIWKISFRRSL